MTTYATEMSHQMGEGADAMNTDASATPKNEVASSYSTSIKPLIPWSLETLGTLSDHTNKISLAKAAKGYGELEIPIFPLKPGTKFPYKGMDWREKASSDTDRIVRHWHDHPDSNIAIPTGVIFSALDVDVKNGAPGWQSLHRLNRGGLLKGAFAQASTPSGGAHLLFTCNGEGNHAAGKQGHGLDFRGLGGYIVVAPSVITGVGQYQWTEFASERFGTPFSWDEAMRTLTPVTKTVEQPTVNKASKNAQGLIKAVAKAQEGNRNAVLYWAVKRCLESGIEPEVLTPAAMSIGLDAREISRTLESAMKGVQK